MRRRSIVRARYVAPFSFTSLCQRLFVRSKRIGKVKRYDGRIDPAHVDYLGAYLDALYQTLPWEPSDERDTYLTRTSVVLSALAVIGHDILTAGTPPDALEASLARLGELDWRRTNLEWVGIVGSARDGVVQPASSRPAIDATIRYLRQKLGLQAEVAA